MFCFFLFRSVVVVAMLLLLLVCFCCFDVVNMLICCGFVDVAIFMLLLWLFLFCSETTCF